MRLPSRPPGASAGIPPEDGSEFRGSAHGRWLQAPAASRLPRQNPWIDPTGSRSAAQNLSPGAPGNRWGRPAEAGWPREKLPVPSCSENHAGRRAYSEECGRVDSWGEQTYLRGSAFAGERQSYAPNHAATFSMSSQMLPADYERIR